MTEVASASGAKGKGHFVDDDAIELDRIVEEAIDGLPLTAETPLDTAIEHLAARLRAHPERDALLDRLRRLMLGEPETPAPPAPDPA